jgi:hypothetical protein
MENEETPVQATPTAILKAILGYLKNKTTSIGILAVAFWGYSVLPGAQPGEAVMPFTEFAYTLLTMLTVVAVAPFLRLMVFNEAAHYAESGELERDLASGKYTPALCHYWFATFLCYAACIACMASLAK